MCLFRQIFDPATSTLTYLLADPITRTSALIDPVPDQQETYGKLRDQMGLQLRYILATHVPVGQAFSLSALSAKTGARLAAHELAPIEGCDQRLRDGDRIYLGEEMIEVMHTPGATPCSVTFRWHDRLFTGDSLWIGCASDLGGKKLSQAATWYDCVHNRLFCLPDEYLIYPGHDRLGYRVSCISQQKRINAALRMPQDHNLAATHQAGAARS